VPNLGVYPTIKLAEHPSRVDDLFSNDALLIALIGL